MSVEASACLASELCQALGGPSWPPCGHRLPPLEHNLMLDVALLRRWDLCAVPVSLKFSLPLS